MSQALIRYRLVYVDDNRDDITLLREALVEGGHPVDFFGFTEVSAALAAMAMMPCPDLVLSDLHMPQRNGLDLIDAMRSGALSMVPIVLLSGTAEEYQQSIARRAGPVRCITKSADWKGYRALAAWLLEEMRQLRSGR